MKKKFNFKKVSVTKNGDYYQVLFHDDLSIDDEPYFIMQRQFEFPDGGVFNFESHIEELIDQCKVKSLKLTTNGLSVCYGAKKEHKIDISFNASQDTLKELAETLIEMTSVSVVSIEQ